MLLESKTGPMQDLIDMAFDQVKENCEDGSYIRSHQNLICDPVDIIEEIKSNLPSKTKPSGTHEPKIKPMNKNLEGRSISRVLNQARIG